MKSFLSKLVLIFKRPNVGATALMRGLRPPGTRRIFIERILNGYWMLILSVFLVIVSPYKHNIEVDFRSLVTILLLYTCYVLILEIALRKSPQSYDSEIFFLIRILVNTLAISALIWFSSGSKSYFWVFYSLPMLQAAVYFSHRVVSSVTIFNIFAYWLIAVTKAKQAKPDLNFKQLMADLDLNLLGMQSFFLVILSFMFYYFLSSFKETALLRHGAICNGASNDFESALAKQSQVFLSCHSADKEEAWDLTKQLEKRTDSKVWFYERDILPGMSWQKALEDNIYNSDGCIVLFGSQGISHWQRLEIEMALQRASEKIYTIFVVLLPDCLDITNLPAFLKSCCHWTDFRNMLKREAEFNRLAEAIRKMNPGYKL